MKLPVLAAIFSLILASCSPPDSEVKEAEAPAKPEKQAAPSPEPGNVDLATAKTLYDNAQAGAKKLVVLDIRTPQEFRDGHLKGAVNIDYLDPPADFRAALGKLDRDANYLMHCQSGGRSTDAMDIMKELGFTSVFHLKAGYGGWKEAGYETVKE